MSSGVVDADEDMMEWFKRRFLARHVQTNHFLVRDFSQELRRESARRIGRDRELATLMDCLKTGAQRSIWVAGSPGAGKSNLFASAVCHLQKETAPYALILPFRFKVGDERCRRSTFLGFVAERLEACWPAPSEALRDATSCETAASAMSDRVSVALKRVPIGQRVLFCLDGIDEIQSLEPEFATEVIARLLMVEDCCSLFCCGRPEGRIVDVMARLGASTPLGARLAPMSSDDVRAMLLDAIRGSALKELVQLDAEQSDGAGGSAIHNTFIQAVSERSEGLPIYVNHVIGDLHRGVFSPKAPERLPRSLHEYHERLLVQEGLDDVFAVRVGIIALLAIARSALELEEIRSFLVRRGILGSSTDPETSTALLKRALGTVAPLLRCVVGDDGIDRYALYHHSFRTHVLGSARLRENIVATRECMSRACTDIRNDGFSRYLYRYRISLLVEENRIEAAVEAVTNLRALVEQFDALHGRTDAVSEWMSDCALVFGHPDCLGTARVEAWRAFSRRASVQLRRTGSSPTELLVQAALEHGRGSAVTEEAEALLRSCRLQFPVVAPQASALSWSGEALYSSGRAHLGSGWTGLGPLCDERVLAWSLSEDCLVRGAVLSACTGRTELEFELPVDFGLHARPDCFDRVFPTSPQVMAEGDFCHLVIRRRCVDFRLCFRASRLESILGELIDEGNDDQFRRMTRRELRACPWIPVLDVNPEGDLFRAGLRSRDLIQGVQRLAKDMGAGDQSAAPVARDPKGSIDSFPQCMSMVGERFRLQILRGGSQFELDVAVSAPAVFQEDHGAVIDIESTENAEGRAEIAREVYGLGSTVPVLLPGDVVLCWNGHDVPTYAHFRRWCLALPEEAGCVLTIARGVNRIVVEMSPPRLRDTPRVLRLDRSGARVLSESEVRSLKDFSVRPQKRGGSSGCLVLGSGHGLRWKGSVAGVGVARGSALEIIDLFTGSVVQSIAVDRFPRFAVRLNDEGFALLHEPYVGLDHWSIFRREGTHWVKTRVERVAARKLPDETESTWQIVAFTEQPEVLWGGYLGVQPKMIVPALASLRSICPAASGIVAPMLWRAGRFGEVAISGGLLADNPPPIDAAAAGVDHSADETTECTQNAQMHDGDVVELPFRLLKGPGGKVTCVTRLSDRFIVSLDSRGVVNTWQPSRALDPVSSEMMLDQVEAAIPLSMEHAVAVGRGQSLHVFAPREAPRSWIGLNVPCRGVWAGPHGDFFALTTEQTLQRLRLGTHGKTVEMVGAAISHTAPVVCMASAGSWVAVSGLDGVALYDSDSGECCFSRADLIAPFDRLSVLPGVGVLLSSRWSALSVLLDLQTGQDLVPQMSAGHCLAAPGAGWILYAGESDIARMGWVERVRRVGPGPEYARPLVRPFPTAGEARGDVAYEVFPDGAVREFSLGFRGHCERSFLDGRSFLTSRESGRTWREVNLDAGSHASWSRAEILKRLNSDSVLSDECFQWLVRTLKISLTRFGRSNGCLVLAERGGEAAIVRLALPTRNAPKDPSTKLAGGSHS
jgi:hypothetical protein